MEKTNDFWSSKLKSPFGRAIIGPFETFRFHKL